MIARSLAPLLLVLSGCGVVTLPLPGSDDDAPCGASNCDGCCLFNACIEAAKGCGGATCGTCKGCGPDNCSGCCDGSRCVTAVSANVCGSQGRVCLACGDGAECVGGICVNRPGLPCGPQVSCGSGTECLWVVDIYREARCWQPCRVSAECGEGFECAPAGQLGVQAGIGGCVPEVSAGSVWELRRERVTFAATPRNFQVCFWVSGATYCTGSTNSGEPTPRFHFAEAALANVIVDVWMLEEDVVAPACSAQACDAQRRLHTKPAATTAAPTDLRAPPGARSATKEVSLEGGVRVEVRVEVVRS